ncbi:MAG: peptide chain release factor N(5)-glutamine methyltransferase [Oleiphilaceae bacterium]|nr:peptide chain release factor N(5)-glutamine methyltransferase [Oleiphilaceae bacterium]
MSAQITIEQALAMSADIQSETPELDVQLLLAHVLQVEPSYFRTWPEKSLSVEQSQTYRHLLQERLKGRPVAHLTGSRGFWTLDLIVNESTLIPRPDTECLVEAALDLLADVEAASVLDLGTGTGAIALALASEQRNWTVLGSDLESDAVLLARSNAAKNQIRNVDFVQGSWFDPIDKDAKFDLIVSNPPYIDENDVHLSQGDVRYEPLSALVAAEHGLSDIKLISNLARSHLKNGAWLILEHGYDQGDDVRRILSQFDYESIETRQDYGSNDRFTIGRFYG